MCRRGLKCYCNYNHINTNFSFHLKCPETRDKVTCYWNTHAQGGGGKRRRRRIRMEGGGGWGGVERRGAGKGEKSDYFLA